MTYIGQGLEEAGRLLWRLDPDVVTVAWLTLRVAGLAALISVAIGIPAGCFLATRRFRGRGALVSFVNVGMGMPPVVVGLVVSLALWRYGPLGDWQLLYTPWAMVIAQVLMAAPIVTSLSFSAIVSLDERLALQLLALGASRRQADWLLIKEAKFGLLAAVIAGFGRAVSEVGASMMVGGNLKDETRVLTTATVLEVGKGNYELAIAFGLLLLLLVYAVVAALTVLQQTGRRRCS